MRYIFFISFCIFVTINSNYGQHKMGDEFRLGYFKYRIDKIEFQKEVRNSLTKSKADGIYLLVYMTITNLDREKSTLMNSMFKVYDSDKFEFGTSQDAMLVMILNDQDKIFMLKEFPPKIPKEIIMPFEVPSNADIYTLEVSGGLGSSGKSKIILK